MDSPLPSRVAASKLKKQKKPSQSNSTESASTITSPPSIKRVEAEATRETSVEAIEPSANQVHDSFQSLSISKPLIKSLESLSITIPTLIQSQTIPSILSGRDVIGGAQTGSGKTLCFLLPILQKLSLDPVSGFAIVLTPTRELAVQLHEQFLAVGIGAANQLGFNLVCSLILGGMDMQHQAIEINKRKPHVVVATPGRLVDLIRSNGDEIGLSRCKFVVLDEADRLLSPTFAPELSYLFSILPPAHSRQTLLFTATLTEEIETLVNREPAEEDKAKGKLKPVVCRIEQDTTTPSTLIQKYLFIPSHIREPFLYHLLIHPPCEKGPKVKRKEYSTSTRGRGRGRGGSRGGRGSHSNSSSSKFYEDPSDSSDEDEDDPTRVPSTIIFVSKTFTASLLTRMLRNLSISCVSLHSGLSQSVRLSNLQLFRNGQVRVLISTDVGSRGLDVPEVKMVVNWDLPAAWEDYVHRVGRTARAGKEGWAVSFVTERDTEVLKGIEGKINHTLTELSLPEETVLARLNQVSQAKRMASMEMGDEGFGEKKKRNLEKNNSELESDSKKKKKKGGEERGKKKRKIDVDHQV